MLYSFIIRIALFLCSKCLGKVKFSVWSKCVGFFFKKKTACTLNWVLFCFTRENQKDLNIVSSGFVLCFSLIWIASIILVWGYMVGIFYCKALCHRIPLLYPTTRLKLPYEKRLCRAKRAPALAQFAQNVSWTGLECWLGDTSGITLFLSTRKQRNDFWNLDCLKVPSVTSRN